MQMYCHNTAKCHGSSTPHLILHNAGGMGYSLYYLTLSSTAFHLMPLTASSKTSEICPMFCCILVPSGSMFLAFQS